MCVGLGTNTIVSNIGCKEYTTSWRSAAEIKRRDIGDTRTGLAIEGLELCTSESAGVGIKLAIEELGDSAGDDTGDNTGDGACVGPGDDTGDGNGEGAGAGEGDDTGDDTGVGNGEGNGVGNGAGSGDRAGVGAGDGTGDDTGDSTGTGDGVGNDKGDATVGTGIKCLMILGFLDDLVPRPESTLGGRFR